MDDNMKIQHLFNVIKSKQGGRVFEVHLAEVFECDTRLRRVRCLNKDEFVLPDFVEDTLSG